MAAGNTFKFTVCICFNFIFALFSRIRIEYAQGNDRGGERGGDRGGYRGGDRRGGFDRRDNRDRDTRGR